MIAVKARILRRDWYLEPKDWKIATLCELTLAFCGDDFDQASSVKKYALEQEPTNVRVMRALTDLETVVEYFTEAL